MKVIFNINGKKVPIQSLKYKSKEDQLEAMRTWFFENFEDPAISCPYESRAGGYSYIYGGPYEADQELQEMFDGYANPSVIQELVDELQEQCYEWSSNSNNIDDWYNEDLYDAVISSEKPFTKFVENIDRIKVMVREESKHPDNSYLYGLLYTNIITSLEALYVELFIRHIKKEKIYITNYIEHTKTNFKVSKKTTAMLFKDISIEEIQDKLAKEINEYLINESWHNSDTVVKRYKSTFGIEVTNNWPIAEIEEATLIRNHLIHRNGKDKEGNPVVITEQNLEKLLNDAMSLGEKLYNSLGNTAEENSYENDLEF